MIIFLFSFPFLVPIFYLSTSKEIIFCWLPSHINIRGNEIADQEAKAALSSPILNFKIPHSDFKSNIHQYISNKCQSNWEKQIQSKLREIKPIFFSVNVPFLIMGKKIRLN